MYSAALPMVYNDVGLARAVKSVENKAASARLPIVSGRADQCKIDSERYCVGYRARPREFLSIYKGPRGSKLLAEQPWQQGSAWAANL